MSMSDEDISTCNYTNTVSLRHISTIEEDLKNALKSLHYAKQWILLTQKKLHGEHEGTCIDKILPPPETIRL